MIIVLAGGVGGSRLACGLAALLGPDEVLFVVNTADDFEHLGFHISPDVDTVMYALAGCANAETGWGIAGETWNFMDALARVGGETWFRLGDRDLATHAERTRRLRAGESLSEVTAVLCHRYGVWHPVAPMSDAPVRTVVTTESEGELAFQQYFVRRRCEPIAARLEYRGAASARPSPAFERALRGPVDALVIGPSNPLLSIAPILALPGVRDRLSSLDVPRIAVSPFVGGKAVKGPADKLMRELGYETSTRGIATFYADVVNGIVVDSRDAAEPMPPGMPALAVHATDTLMKSPADRERVARAVLDLATRMKAQRKAR
jgi:LPPG:FO 2-phospho-L-lactate transferase